MYFIVQGLSGGRPGCANPNLSSWWIEGDLKVFKHVTDQMSYINVRVYDYIPEIDSWRVLRIYR